MRAGGWVGGWVGGSAQAVGWQRYRALLAWENTQDENYVSEKVYQALAAGVVPVYWGAPDIEDFVPGRMIINANAQPRVNRVGGRCERGRRG